MKNQNIKSVILKVRALQRQYDEAAQKEEALHAEAVKTYEPESKAYYKKMAELEKEMVKLERDYNKATDKKFKKYNDASGKTNEIRRQLRDAKEKLLEMTLAADSEKTRG